VHLAYREHHRLPSRSSLGAGGAILSARGRLDDLEDELPEVLLLANGPGGQPLGDLAVEDENQAELDTVAFAGRARKPGDGKLRGGPSGVR
jgi:hypothetical protein